MYLNRLQLGECEYLSDIKTEPFSFKPTISKNSIEMAKKYRNKVI
jgi:hypothetical protein